MTDAEMTLKGPVPKILRMQKGSPALKGRCGMALVSMATLVMLSGCITVNAPDKPIVIELNINIRQEVIYRLAEDASNTIEENADIF